MSLLRTMKRDLSRICPYYRRGATCVSGCWTEPYCITGQPLNGWPWERLFNRAKEVKRCTGVLSHLDGQADCGRMDHKHSSHPYYVD